MKANQVIWYLFMMASFLICHNIAFYIKPYNSHWFSEQLEFYQVILTLLLKDPPTWAVSYENALR